MPSVAEQLRTSRRRRARLRRAVLGALVIAPTAALSVDALGQATSSTTAGGASAATTSAPTDLNPGLVDAFDQAQAGAAEAGHRLTVTSGFRTAEEQAALLEAEVAERGSLEEALWWVFPPEQSMHVQGLAIDVGDGPAADWLAQEGAQFGLCRTLAWEWWHFEWRERWEATGTCPAPAQAPEDAPHA